MREGNNVKLINKLVNNVCVRWVTELPEQLFLTSWSSDVSPKTIMGWKANLAEIIVQCTESDGSDKNFTFSLP